MVQKSSPAAHQGTEAGTSSIIPDYYAEIIRPEMLGTMGFGEEPGSAFRHGLRAAEVCDLRWEQIEFETAVLHVRTRKNGAPSVHPLSGWELRVLRRLNRESEASPFVFVSERGSPFTVAGFQKLIARGGEKAGFEFPSTQCPTGITPKAPSFPPVQTLE